MRPFACKLKAWEEFRARDAEEVEKWYRVATSSQLPQVIFAAVAIRDITG
jgi:hypothetical protein